MMRTKALIQASVTLLAAIVLLAGCSPVMTAEPATPSAALNSFPESSAQPAAAAPVPVAVQQAMMPPLVLGDLPATQPRFDVVAEQVDARAFFAGLVTDTPTNLVVHPDVQGAITLHLKNVTLQEVLSIVRDVYGFHYRTIAGGYQILPNNMQTQIFEVDYLTLKRSGHSLTRVNSGQVSAVSNDDDNGNDNDNNSSSNGTTSSSGSRITTVSESDFWTGLQQALQSLVGRENGRAVIVQPQAGLVVVRALPQELQIVTDYLNKTQVTLQRQVILEAKIIEVELNDGYQTGINWAGLIHNGNNTATIGQVGGGTYLSDGVSEIAGTNPLVNGLVTSAFGGVFSTTLQFDDFEAFIEAVKSQGDVQVLSSPRISTLNNQKAVIKVGTDEFFVTDISSDTVTGTTTTTTPDITLTPFFSGIALDVTPQISGQGRVTLHVHPTVSEVVDQTKVITVAGQAQSLPLAFSSVRESDTIVEARSGQVVVIGGLMKNSDTREGAGVPLLGDIPGLGHLFRHQKNSTSKSELIILLKPLVVERDTDWNNDIEAARQRMNSLF
ncbi:pilus (MSHA type) biogenesis protein MshL [Desulfuromonas acetoxidans]|uniref:Type II and III secretion system protein n=1 Tax=Desulfuromonas acetoxidans (strain DSM 684 / 11070) TaxID=281689 RepID=Q1K1Z0_DESA6|nr:pilus (MSHA type) biogenesis protein MshL [Desulfuromonas acetoxidans]EAT16649.1 type II and III secretion system protein [Desulfuromonas acetoxidans DSM 684]MBF0646476.1 pilus (MSHA type) biogenesis protein MshL [Desulfuromonas acetoxidans]NVD24760.1 pilus (MSHA type) biogenesis protein MshL [Desulfuromonas acetoxidans]NVE16805.1 pilus (MSHA type) biogenesis protein MshL [Desulfuromonas acetoxidans]